MPEELSYGELLQGIRDGQPDAQSQLFHQYVHRLIGLARHRLSERAQRKTGAEDVVQSALHSFFLHHTQELNLQGETGLWDKLLEVTLRHCGKWNKRFRARKRQAVEMPIHPGGDGTAGGVEPSDDEPPPEEAVILAELVENLLADMTDRQRQVFQLRLQGCSVAEISTQMCVSEAIVYRTIEQLRSQVSARLADGQ